ncbi:serine-rich adhesin for platelets-like [Anopheles bellator]|uniref:serine-rich adhesin for platelets-like n=1 Tax=Anopheles bellator TaxID=139047 RepID=UPI002649BEB3|nr:serine-rich adhesin for platelets-like [Anopheles bellator]
MSYRNYHLSKDATPASRFSSLSSSSTSSYRPLYGSGSYRSPRSATTLSASSTVSSFISRYSNLSIDKDKEQGCDRAKEDERRKQRELREKERVKERDREKERLIETSKKLEAQIKESKPSPLRKSALIAVKYGSTKDISSSEDPSAKGPIVTQSARKTHRPLPCSPPLTSSQAFSPESQSCVQATESKQESSSSSETTTTEDSSEENENSLQQEPKIFIEISLVTRGTSPTRPGTTPLIRTRRVEIGKTIETTIRKQLLPVETADKQMQSDRMDDSTRYLRYNQPSCRSWSPFFDSKEGTSSPTPLYTRYSSSSSKYNRDTPSLSRETSVSSTKSGASENHELSKLAARVKDLSLSTQNSTKPTASLLTDTGTNIGRPRTLLKQSSPEKPPAVPTKDGIVSMKSVANKDFRKSALNMGPASERPCKSSSSSSSTKSSSSYSSSSGASTAAQIEMTKGKTAVQINQNGISARSSLSPSCEDTSGSSNTETDRSSTDREQSLVRTSSVALDESQNTTNNELLRRAIQLATNFVMNQNRGVPERCYENTSTEQYLPSDVSGKAGWEAGTHYMESIKDDSSDQDDVEQGQFDSNKDDEGRSVLQRMTWWRKSDNFEPHSPKQEDTIQESLPSVRNFCYRIQRVESGEKPWWLSEETKRPESEETSEEKPMSAVTALMSAEGTSESEAGDGRSTVTGLFDSQALNSFHPIQVTRIESGEKAWWMNSSDNLTDKVNTEQNIEASCKSPTLRPSNSSDSGGKKRAGFIVCTLEAEDEAWWEEAMTGLKRKDSTSGSSSTSVSRGPSHEPTPEPRNGQLFRVSHVRSGDKAWWLYSSDNDEKTQSKTEHTSESEFVHECSPVKAKPFKITRIESGEQPWWMLETSEGPLLSRSGSKLNSNSLNSSKKGSGQTSPTKYRITHVESGEKAWWMMSDTSDNLADSPRKLSTFAEKHDEEETSLHDFENETQIGKELHNVTKVAAGLPKFPIGEYAAEMLGETPPLGHRASPEGIEDNSPRLGGRVSPYDNIPSAATTVDERFLASGTVGSNTNGGVVPFKDIQCQSAFITHLTNIDDLLGKSCHPLSPIMDQMFIMDGAVQEIAPEDVHFHDSTARFIDYGSGSADRVHHIDRTATQVIRKESAVEFQFVLTVA